MDDFVEYIEKKGFSIDFRSKGIDGNKYTFYRKSSERFSNKSRDFIVVYKNYFEYCAFNDSIYKITKRNVFKIIEKEDGGIFKTKLDINPHDFIILYI